MQEDGVLIGLLASSAGDASVKREVYGVDRTARVSLRPLSAREADGLADHLVCLCLSTEDGMNRGGGAIDVSASQVRWDGNDSGICRRVVVKGLIDHQSEWSAVRVLVRVARDEAMTSGNYVELSIPDADEAC